MTDRRAAIKTQVFATANTLLELPVLVVVAWARLVLAAFVSFSVNNFTVSPELNQLLEPILLCYCVFAVAVVIATTLLKYVSPWTSYIVHGVDVATATVVMLLSQSLTSFVFFQFTLIAATLRWNWRGALGTAGILTVSLWVLYWVGVSPGPDGTPTGANDLTGTLLRGGFLWVGGVMLAYLGAYRERSRRRFAKLAAWPAVHNTTSNLELLEALLKYSADVTQAPRLLVIWDERDEPDRRVALWSERGLQYSQEQPGTFEAMVAPGQGGTPFVYQPALSDDTHTANAEWVGGQLDRDLVHTFAIRSAVSAPFSTARCSGRVFVLDSPASEEDLPLVSVIASRIGTSLEARILRQQLQLAAATEERTKLSRDLHDGVLQGLAAANMQLKVVSLVLPPDVQEQIRTIRNTLSDEAQRIRNFVEANRATAPSPTGIVPLASEIEKRVARLRDLWACEIALSIDPPDLETSLTAVRSVGHMIAEGVSNAVRHGRASRVKVSVSKRGDRLTLNISDNGNGFDNLAGAYTSSELTKRNAGPLSLKSRAEECGGTLYLTSSAEGTHLTAELPT